MSAPIQVGDKVEIRGDHRELTVAQFYGAKAQGPFVVEQIDRTRGRFAAYGNGMLIWRSHLRRVRTKRQLERDEAKKAEAAK